MAAVLWALVVGGVSIGVIDWPFNRFLSSLEIGATLLRLRTGYQLNVHGMGIRLAQSILQLLSIRAKGYLTLGVPAERALRPRLARYDDLDIGHLWWATLVMAVQPGP